MVPTPLSGIGKEEEERKNAVSLYVVNSGLEYVNALKFETDSN
jgi:hypothetical protein